LEPQKEVLNPMSHRRSGLQLKLKDILYLCLYSKKKGLDKEDRQKIQRKFKTTIDLQLRRRGGDGKEVREAHARGRSAGGGEEGRERQGPGIGEDPKGHRRYK
jgi:hypothetical protein